MGHLIKVSNMLNKLADKDDYVREALASNKRWLEYCEDILDPTNQKDSYDLGGARKISVEENEMVQRFDDDHERVSSNFSSLNLPTDTFGSLFPANREENDENDAGDKEEEQDCEKENQTGVVAVESSGEGEKKSLIELGELDKFLAEKRHQIRFPLSNSPPRQIAIDVHSLRPDVLTCCAVGDQKSSKRCYPRYGRR